jgi:hypothetical protein
VGFNIPGWCRIYKDEGLLCMNELQSILRSVMVRLV